MSSQITETTPVVVAAPAAVSNITTPSTLLSIAVAQGADLDRLEKLFEMQVRWEANEARKAYAESFSQFKANESVHIHKDKFVSFNSAKGKTEYAHSSIGNVVKTITEAISKYGFSHNWLVQQDNLFVTVTCVLKHRQGHFEEVSLTSAADSSGGKNAIQGLASAITYLQRYTLLSITGCATSDDDDGRSTSNDETEQQVNGLAGSLTDQLIARVNAAQTLDELMAVWGTGNGQLTAYPDLHAELKAACTARRTDLRKAAETKNSQDADETAEA